MPVQDASHRLVTPTGHLSHSPQSPITEQCFGSTPLSAAAKSSTVFSEGAAFGLGMSYTGAVKLEAENNRSGKNTVCSLVASLVDPQWAIECRDAQPFGVYLGTGLELVPAFSNGAVEDISHGESYLPGTQIYCGMPWECLEYARRFLLAWYGITFSSLDGANSLFDCNLFTYLENFEKPREQWTAPDVVVKREVNGEATQVPVVGSLLLYPIVYPAADMPFGHVAVVVERSAHHIRVAEQNWDNSKWAHQRYSRQLEVLVDEATGKVTVIDEDPYTVLGWLDFSDNERRPPKWDHAKQHEEVLHHKAHQTTASTATHEET